MLPYAPPPNLRLLPTPRSISSAHFGADSASTPVGQGSDSSWFASPLKFFATLGAGIAVGYLIAKK